MVRPAGRGKTAQQLAIAFFAPFLAVGLFVALIPTRMNRQVETQAHGRVVGLARVLADALVAPLELRDADSASRVLALLSSQQEAEVAVLVDRGGRRIAAWHADDVMAGGGIEPPPGGATSMRSGKHLIAAAPVQGRVGTVGHLVMSFGTGQVDAVQRSNWLAAILLVLFAGGALAAMFAGMRTRRRRAERALAHEEARFSAIVDGMPDGLIIYERGQPTYANSSARRLFGLGSEACAPKRTRALAALEVRGGGGEPSRVVSIEGEAGALQFEVRSLGLAVDGAPVEILLARDVTEEERLRARVALSDRLASIGTMATGVAHEINNPLSYLRSNLEFLDSELAGLCEPVAAASASPELLELLAAAARDARSGAARVQHVVQDVRELAHRDFGERLPVEAKKIASAAIALARATMGQRARIESEHDKNVPLVIGLESRLVQVVMHLIINGVQAIPSDAPAERQVVRVSTRATSKGMVEIAVADTGTGIPAAVRDRIFDPFFTTKSVGVGTGLGLAISQAIVQAHGGSIEIETEAGAGTTMRLRLPAAPDRINSDVARALARRGPTRVLVMGDDVPPASATELATAS